MTLRLARPLATLAACAALGGCAELPPPASPEIPQGLASPFAGYQSAHYKDPKAWLCLPGRDDACAANLDATDLLPDGTGIAVRDTLAPGADKVDCFYVYPTVDLRIRPANHQSFDDLGPMTRATVAQAARLRSTCRLYVPLYRQITIGTYLLSPESRERYLSVAASDVMDAFVHYMGAFNGGRKIVLVGHSQGAEMVNRTLQRFFDADPAMRERLLLALPIGGHVEVATGATTGGSFAQVPVCSRAGETGCVVAYRSYLAGIDVAAGAVDAPSPGRETVCVNPATLDTPGRRRFSRAFLPLTGGLRGLLKGVDGVTTPFVMLRDFYEGQCVQGKGGFRYLAVSAPPQEGDTRVSPFDLSSRWLKGPLGMHVLDFQLEQGDLVDLVARRAAALP